MASLWGKRCFVVSLTAILVAGCGAGGDPGANVAASLRDYIESRPPGDSFLPLGAGPPRIADNACRDRHVNTKKVVSTAEVKTFSNRVGLWSCVVTFRRLALPTLVAVNDDHEVVWFRPGRFDQYEVK